MLRDYLVKWHEAMKTEARQDRVEVEIEDEKDISARNRAIELELDKRYDLKDKARVFTAEEIIW